MKKIKVMSLVEMKGIRDITFLRITCLLFVAGGIWMIFDDSILHVIGGWLCILFFGGAGFFLFRGETTYVPGKSFRWARLTTEKQKKLHVYSLILCVTILIILIITQMWQSLGYAIVGSLVLYYSIKSLKVHEDVDYTTNQAMEDLIGMDIDEKVCASYQNFDGEQKKNVKGDNLLVVTNRKIFYATHNGKVWMILKRSFDDLVKIGHTNGNSSGSESILIMTFKDATSIKLKMDVLDKPTSNPTLFFKQFLNVLDAYVMGYDMVRNNTRRRVAVGGTAVDNSQIEASKSNNVARKVNLELSGEILTQMQMGQEFSGNRRLEL